MDQKMRSDWDHAINVLMELEPEKRKHFALLVVNLAKCYVKDSGWKAVILINNSDALLTFSAGADEYEAAGMLQMANDAVSIAAAADAPDREMYN